MTTAERKEIVVGFLLPHFQKYLAEHNEYIAKNMSKKRLTDFLVTRVASTTEFFDKIRHKYDLPNDDILQFCDLNAIFNTMNDEWCWTRVRWCRSNLTQVNYCTINYKDEEFCYETSANEDFWFIDMEDAAWVLEDEFVESEEDA